MLTLSECGLSRLDTGGGPRMRRDGWKLYPGVASSDGHVASPVLPPPHGGRLFSEDLVPPAPLSGCQGEMPPRHRVPPRLGNSPHRRNLTEALCPVCADQRPGPGLDQRATRLRSKASRQGLHRGADRGETSVRGGRHTASRYKLFCTFGGVCMCYPSGRFTFRREALVCSSTCRWVHWLIPVCT